MKHNPSVKKHAATVPKEKLQDYYALVIKRTNQAKMKMTGYSFDALCAKAAKDMIV